MKEQGRLQSMVLQRVGHNCVTNFHFDFHSFVGASLIAHLVKNPPAMQKTQVQSLGWEDPLEKGMAAHLPGVFLPGEFHGPRGLAGYSP